MMMATNRWLVEECQRGQRKPNEDAALVLLRVIRESVGGFAIRSRANLKMGARSDAKPASTFADRAPGQAAG
jgi:hypothetical protein